MACDGELRVVEASNQWVVVDKPAGLLSVPGIGEEKKDCVVARVRAMFPAATGPMMVHRLDMDTSGLMVVALTPGAQRALSGQFERRETHKRYVALLDGIVAHADEGEVDAPLRLDVSRRPFQVYDWLHGREAVTRWRVLSFEVDRTRVALWPLTGRTHQLRVHAALLPPIGIGRAIVGDPLYGRRLSGERLMLHAGELGFSDPGGGGGVLFRSAVPF